MEEDYNRDYLELLAHKYKEGSLTEEEATYFEKWYNSFADEKLELPAGYGANPISVRERIQVSLAAKVKADKMQSRRNTLRISPRWQRIIAAATIFMVLGAFLYSYFYNQPVSKSYQSSFTAINISPGSSRAVLTLSGGQKISLSGAAQGVIASDAQTQITQTANGQIVYEIASQARHDDKAPTSYNTIETPRGGAYQITLPDGTEVWLNAASSLKYPISFNERGKAGERRTRLVELSGEAYFQVAKDKEHPFVVKTSTQQVEVLGTHFNINSYADGTGPTTTLTEGSVRLSTIGRSHLQSVVLKPGEQGVQQNNNFKVSQADLTTALAWQNGKLKFRDAALPEIMKEVSRWYDIDVRYEGAIPDDLFTGGISRKSNLNSLLKIFEASQIKFKLEQNGNRRTLIVIP